MAQVSSGLEVLLRNGPSRAGLPAGARLGVVLHPASVDAHGRHALERLREHEGFEPVRLFAPEHGLWGREQDMETVDGSADPWSGLPVVSLYGETEESLRPGASDLEGLDAILFDLQDVGSRYYTFVYTLSFVMEAAGEAGIPVVVLDRPNPIGGLRIEGPLVAPSLTSFVGRFPLPPRHGMTVGELARLFRDEFGIDCDLRVVPMEGWRRAMGFEETGLPWVPPSPNMPTVSTALVYPGGCLVEGTSLSEGRGTTTPFELVGAPGLDPWKLASALRDEDLPGVAFRAAGFRPMFQKHAGALCGGVQVIVRDSSSFRPFATYLVLLREARRLGGKAFGWRTEPYEFVSDRLAIDLLLGRTDLRERIETGEPLLAMESSWERELRNFEAMQRVHRLYD